MTALEEAEVHQDDQDDLARLSVFVERARRMAGWTFDEVRSSRAGPGPSWDYVAKAQELVSGARACLDIGTGGGEAFSTIWDGHAGLGVATEVWAPNVLVAANRLSPIGVRVIQASGSNLPFSANSFDVVLNRHEELSPSDVARVLVQGGQVLTQQIGRNEWQEIVPFFPMTSPEGSDDLFQRYKTGFEGAGLTVTVADSHDTPVAYHSLGDVVYMMTVVMPQWRAHDFDLERDLEALLALEQELTGEKGIVLTESRFVIQAAKGR